MSYDLFLKHCRDRYLKYVKIKAKEKSIVSLESEEREKKRKNLETLEGKNLKKIKHK